MRSKSRYLTILYICLFIACQRRVHIDLPINSIVASSDLTFPSVTVEQAVSESVGSCTFNAMTDPATNMNIEFRVIFSEPINPVTFTAADISNSGTGGSVALDWTIVDCGDNSNFKITATLIKGTGTIIPSLIAGVVQESSGNSNLASGSADNSVNFIGGWYQEAYIKAANSEAGDEFGYALSQPSMSLYKDTLAVGSIYEDSNESTITNGPLASADNSLPDSGAVYIYKRTGNLWAQEAYIKAANAATLDDFGFSIALSGDTLAVGAKREDSIQNTITNGSTASGDDSRADSGAVYVYKRSGSTWTQEAYIKAVNNNLNDQLGNAVSLDGDTLVVGAYIEDSNQTTITNGATASANTSTVAAGAVFVYRRTGSTWVQEAYIKAANNHFGDYFGSYVALDKDTISVAHMNDRSNQTTITNGTTASTNTALMIAGAVFVYKRTGVNWAQEAYIKPSVIGNFAGFGTYGAPVNGNMIIAMAGSGLYTFTRSGATWTQESVSALPLGVSDIKGNTLVVGAFGDDSNQTTITNGTGSSADVSNVDSGAVYVYRKSGVSWVQEAYIKAPNNSPGDKFGSGVKLHGDTIAVVAPYEASNQTTITNGITASTDDSNASSGAVYIFRNNGRLFEIHDLRATATSNSVSLSWSRTGGTATGYYVAYQPGATAPADCNSGTNINVGDVEAHLETPLSSSTTYSFRVCASDGTLLTDGSSLSVTTLP